VLGLGIEHDLAPSAATTNSRPAAVAVGLASLQRTWLFERLGWSSSAAVATL
jgi:hypothetical protein